MGTTANDRSLSMEDFVHPLLDRQSASQSASHQGAMEGFASAKLEAVTWSRQSVCLPAIEHGGTKREKASVTGFSERVRTRSKCELRNRRRAAPNGKLPRYESDSRNRPPVEAR